MGSQFSNSSVNTFNMINLVIFCLVGLATAAPAPQTANEVATRIVAVSKSKPELLSPKLILIFLELLLLLLILLFLRLLSQRQRPIFLRLLLLLLIQLSLLLLSQKLYLNFLELLLRKLISSFLELPSPVESSQSSLQLPSPNLGVILLPLPSLLPSLIFSMLLSPKPSLTSLQLLFKKLKLPSLL